MPLPTVNLCQNSCKRVRKWKNTEKICNTKLMKDLPTDTSYSIVKERHFYNKWKEK